MLRPFLFSCALAVLACGESDPAGAAGGSDAGAACAGDPGPGPAGSRCITEVTGRVVDDSSAGVGGLPVTVCGAVCFYGRTEPQGRFTVTVGHRIAPADYSVSVHARPDHLSFYHRLPDDPGPRIDAGDLLLLALPVGGPLLDLGPGPHRARSGDVTLEIPDGTRMKLDPEDLAAGDRGRRLRTVRIDADGAAGLVPPSLGLDVAYGFSPFEAWFEGPDGEGTTARLSFENGSSLAPGARVELLALGSYLFPDWVEPAVFEKVAGGAVTSDGARIEMDPGDGIRYLTWIGLRERKGTSR